MSHHHHPTHDAVHHPHQRTDAQDQHRILDLDAEVFGAHLAAVLDLAGVFAPRSVVDLGAGTGAGSRLLRSRYPEAALTCVDNDPQMLELLRAQGFTVVEADLDDGFPALSGTVPTATAAAADSGVDLVWASSSLHHVARPARLLSGVHDALASGGVLVIAELATLPDFVGISSQGDPRDALLEQRCHSLAAAEGWNHYPDWTPFIEAAGFRATRSEVTTVAPVTPAAREYAQEWLARFSRLAGLTADDRAAVEDLVHRLRHGLPLGPRAIRTVWVATPDRNSTPN
ncbi:MAG: class I SAM-dependent methyltransferase [Nakamurella sp.]